MLFNIHLTDINKNQFFCMIQSFGGKPALTIRCRNGTVSNENSANRGVPRSLQIWHLHAGGGANLYHAAHNQLANHLSGERAGQAANHPGEGNPLPDLDAGGKGFSAAGRKMAAHLAGNRGSDGVGRRGAVSFFLCTQYVPQIAAPDFSEIAAGKAGV